MDESTIIAVVGAGTMGIGIAQIASTSGHTVLLYDAYNQQLREAKKRLHAILQYQVQEGRMSQEKADGIIGRIRFVEDMTGFKKCGLVLEAVVENLEVKKDVFARLEAIVDKECILGTNTSALTIASISAALKKPGRFMGIHFFNPAPLMQLVELIPGIATEPQATQKAQALINNWGKKTVLAKDTPGFIVNRVSRPFYGEALRLLEEGIADVATIDWAMKTEGGFKMGPFELMDFIGNDISYKTTLTVFEEFFYDSRFRPSFTQKRMVQAGLLGKKAGRGFYDYNREANEVEINKDPQLTQKIVNRILVMLINEAIDAVFMNIATAEEVDLAMTYGVNYPKGLLRWADEIGLREVLDRITALRTKYREDRYRPNPLLKQMVREEQTFYGG